jgi:hypothetical protein
VCSLNHERVLKLDVRPLDSFPAFHGTGRLNTEFTRALRLFLSSARPIQSTLPHPTSPRSPNLIFIFRSLGRLSKESVQVRASFMIFVTSLFLRWRVVSPTPKLEDYPLSFVRGCLFNILIAILHSWRSFLHPQREDAPCWGDRDPHLTWAPYTQKDFLVLFYVRDWVNSRAITRLEGLRKFKKM